MLGSFVYLMGRKLYRSVNKSGKSRFNKLEMQEICVFVLFIPPRITSKPLSEINIINIEQKKKIHG